MKRVSPGQIDTVHAASAKRAAAAFITALARRRDPLCEADTLAP